MAELERERKAERELRPESLIDELTGGEARPRHLRARNPTSRGANETLESLSRSWIRQNLPSEQIKEIEKVATEVFGDAAVALEWLQDPNLATYDKPPISLLGTDDGFIHLKNLLKRIEYGNLA